MAFIYLFINQIFVKDNQSDADTTAIEQLKIFGVPISTVNMNDFKRVVGKAGERH